MQEIDLNGKVLIAMPEMGDPRFSRSVIFMCAYSPEGAMGLIVNKPTEELRLSNLLDQLDITETKEARDLPIHFGGPVEHGRGFVLHSYGYHSSLSTLDVNDDFAMTATLDILEDLANGRGPDRAIITLGYSGWGPGQLEGELAQNAWLVCDADHQLIFGTPNEQKWDGALKKLGISALTLSADAGRA